MRDQPPEDLVALLERLHLATRAQVQSVAPRARKLACELPLFNSVWIDALAQARLLMPYQAAEINAGRGEQLLVGPYLIQKLVQQLDYANCYLAKKVIEAVPDGAPEENQATKKTAEEFVHLFVARGLATDFAPQVTNELKSSIEKLAHLDSPIIASIQSADCSSDSVWAASAKTEGFPAIDWISCQGRLPAVIVLEIARQMAAALAWLEQAGVSHGDISASTLWLSPSGTIQLIGGGICAILRGSVSDGKEPPRLGSLDYTAPEALRDNSAGNNRVVIKTNVGDQSLVDIYACGCLWWHLLAGRAPIAGGDVPSKIAVIERNRILDIRQIAPDTPVALAEIIQRCTCADPQKRPQSFRDLAESLGPATPSGRRRLAVELLRGGRATMRPDLTARLNRGVRHAAQPLLAATICAILIAAATSPLWKSRPQVVLQAIVGKQSLLSDAGDRNATLELLRRFGFQTPQSKERSRSATVDRNVHQVSFQAADATAANSAPDSGVESNRPIIELAGSTETLATSLRLQRGCIVRGSSTARPMVVIPPRGLAVTADHVRFESIDFVWRGSSSQIVVAEPPTMLVIRAARVEFVGCTFQTDQIGLGDTPVAIRLAAVAQSRALAPASQVKIERCVINGTAAGVECDATGPIAIEIQNTLFLGPGPLIHFPLMRRADAPTEIELDRVSTRNASSVVQFNCDDTADEIGSINVAASDCVYSPAADGALVALSAPGSVKSITALLKSIAWTGRGSLADPKMAIVQNRSGAKRESLPDDELALDGIVASAFEFEGTMGSDPRMSRVKKWLAPLESDKPPGIGDDLPPLPESKSPPK